MKSKSLTSQKFFFRPSHSSLDSFNIPAGKTLQMTLRCPELSCQTFNSD